MGKIFIVFCLSIIYSNLHLWSQEERVPLEVFISNIQSHEGRIIIEIFREGDDIPKKPFRKEVCEIVNDAGEYTLSDLSYGDYAIIVFHDLNSNGEVDHSWGFPSEPIGFSNDWRISLFSGMPNFKKLAFKYSQQHHSIKIELD